MKRRLFTNQRNLSSNGTICVNPVGNFLQRVVKGNCDFTGLKDISAYPSEDDVVIKAGLLLQAGEGSFSEAGKHCGEQRRPVASRNE